MNFLNEILGTLKQGLILFVMFACCAAFAIGIGYSIFGDHDMMWIRVVGFVVFIFLLGKVIRE